MKLPRPLPGLIATLSLGFIATQAQAQDYRPDAEGHPCDARIRLTVVQDGQSYAIRTRPIEAAKPQEAAAPSIAIGTSLKLDGAIFAHSPLATQDVSNAPRR